MANLSIIINPSGAHRNTGILPIWLIVFSVSLLTLRGQTGGAPSDPGVQGQMLVKSILDSWPASSFTNTGTLKIRDERHKTVQLALTVRTVALTSQWENIYQTTGSNGTETLEIIHTADQPNRYLMIAAAGDHSVTNSPGDLMAPFAQSDFWLADLGLEFFHWPAQKILKKEVRRSRGCIVLESTNPNPGPKTYSRVLSWIDEESNGIIHAEAYDFNNGLLKEFDPKSFKKVKGQWELQEMEIDNAQTESRTRLDLDLPK
jgi:hypothetical protein